MGRNKRLSAVERWSIIKPITEFHFYDDIGEERFDDILQVKSR